MLFVFAVMGMVAWQSTRATPLIDYSYQVENAYRIFRGQVPYRDFFLVVSPGTYILMALFMQGTGGYVHLAQVLHTMLIAVGTVACTYWIIEFILRNKSLALLFCLPLLFSGAAIYPYPLYDTHAVFFILVSLWILLIFFRKNIHSVFLHAIAGILCALPIFMKQNIGLVYTAVVCSFIVLSLIHTLFRKHSIQLHMAFLFGVFGILALTLFWLLTTGVFEHAAFQLFTFPRFSKNPIDGIHVIAYELTQFVQQGIVYLKYSIPIIIVFSIIHRLFAFDRHRWLLTIGITLSGIVYFFFSRDKTGLSELYILHWWGYLSISFVLLLLLQIVPRYRASEMFMVGIMILLLLVSYATFLSHGIVGSSNAVWPLSLIIFSVVIRMVNRLVPSNIWQQVSIGFVIVLTVVLGYRVFIQKNMEYISLDGDVVAASSNSLYGLSTPGPWVNQFESLIAFVKTNIPPDDSVAFLPGEDPFFSATGRINPLQFSLLHASVYTLQPHMIVSELLTKRVQWIVMKRTFQTKPHAWFNNMIEITGAVSPYYTATYELDNYMLYKRKPL